MILSVADNSTLHVTSAEALTDLSKIADLRIDKISLESNPHLLVFPHSFTAAEDRIGESEICSLQGNKLITGNVMGFAGVGQTELSIHSRFAPSSEEDYFLHYMLHRVFSINMFSLEHSISNESIFDFLLYMFPYFLKKAMRQGLYKEYRVFNRHDANLRGTIDIAAFINQDIPFAGKMSYRTREFSYDNPVTELVRHTIEYIRTREIGSAVLNVDEATRTAVTQIVAATGEYDKNARRQVIGRNIKPLRHPYFSEYRPLQAICLQILRHDKIKYGSDDKQVYGILFDGAWLWEEYLALLLKESGYRHPRNKDKTGRIYLFERPDEQAKEDSMFSLTRGSRYPDFIKRGVILDAKYKHLESGSIARDDLHQVITYMYVEKSRLGGFIAPTMSQDYGGCRGHLRGHGGSLWIHLLPIPQQASSFHNFSAEIHQYEKKMIEHLQQMENSK